MQNTQDSGVAQSLKLLHIDALAVDLKGELCAAWEMLQKASATTSDRWNAFNHHKGCLNEHQFPSLLEAAAEDHARASELISRQSTRRVSFAVARVALIQSIHELVYRREQFDRTVLKVHGALSFIADCHLHSALAAELLMYIQQAEAINEKFIERTQRESNTDVTEGAARRALRSLYREVTASRKLGVERKTGIDTYGLLAIPFQRLEKHHPLSPINERLVDALAKLQRGAAYHHIWGWTNHLDPIDWQKTMAQYKMLKTNLGEARHLERIEQVIAGNCTGAIPNMTALQNEKRASLALARQQVTRVLDDVLMAAVEAQKVLDDLLAMDFAPLKAEETDWHHLQPVDTVMSNVVLADALVRHVQALSCEWVVEQSETQVQATTAAKSLKGALDKLLDKPQYRGLKGSWHRNGGSQYFYTEAL